MSGCKARLSLQGLLKVTSSPSDHEGSLLLHFSRITIRKYTVYSIKKCVLK
jgi:hypothetical protein